MIKALDFDTKLLFSYMSWNKSLRYPPGLSPYKIIRKGDVTVVKATKQNLIDLAYGISEWAGDHPAFNEIEVVECMRDI